MVKNMKRKIIKILLAVIVFTFVSCNNHDVNDVNDTENKKAEWIKSAFASLESGKYSRIKAISWWNENWDNEGKMVTLRIDSSPESLDAYRKSVASPTFITSANFQNEKLIAPPTGIYHSAFPDFGGTEDIVTAGRINEFIDLAEKDIVWAYFSNNWTNGINFPTDAVEIISASGKIPFIRLMPRTSFEEYVADTLYSMQKIIDGDFDDELTQWAIDAASAGIPLLAEFGTEVNGSWFPWNGLYNGAGETDGYGDNSIVDGPERFRHAYRHIIDICRQNGATNITWFFHIDADSEPEDEWNDFENYYPGDDYIDWIGVSVYGPVDEGDDYREFSETLDKVYQRMTELTDKPIAVLEFGVTEIK